VARRSARRRTQRPAPPAPAEKRAELSAPTSSLWQTLRRYSFLIVFVVVVAGSATYGALHQAAVNDDAFQPQSRPTAPP